MPAIPDQGGEAGDVGEVRTFAQGQFLQVTKDQA
jgi:hypothetical protein